MLANDGRGTGGYHTLELLGLGQGTLGPDHAGHEGLLREAFPDLFRAEDVAEEAGIEDRGCGHGGWSCDRKGMSRLEEA